MYFNLVNYCNNWKWLGFIDDEVFWLGSDCLVDVVVVYGILDVIVVWLNEYLFVGVDYVFI